jgi:hypothetical protein
MIQSLQHADKLRLMAFLLGEIAREEGVSLSAEPTPKTATTDALAQLAGMAQALGPADLARHFDQYAWANWLTASDELSSRILHRRGGRPVDVDALLAAAKEDLENRHDDSNSRRLPFWAKIKGISAK